MHHIYKTENMLLSVATDQDCHKNELLLQCDIYPPSLVSVKHLKYYFWEAINAQNRTRHSTCGVLHHIISSVKTLQMG